MQVIVADASIAFGSFTVFDGFSARFEAGQVTALVGPSGSGKSSLLAAMAGYVRLRDGSITIVDQGTSLSPHADLVSWVPQGSNALARRSVLDNVLIASLAAGLAMREAVDVAEDALSQVDLMTRSGEQARRLSGGELQRVAIARALASGKDLILADEPSANLDERNTNEVAAILNRLVSRATIIVATHDPILVSSSHAAVHMRQQVSTVG
ncbi:ATP-binding cassette domain-containing protein [Microbacterium sp. Gd 4-13]|uniref:ATP-binding cassette domain-containing protein n=1 Tax=Microbacterium sp. Gd 4-13 TaxID=2173179 RepID=UPI001403EB30|nr:ATP-binding cassette domain-containing protein [Microbacterium sp. Gd 4-13]